MGEDEIVTLFGARGPEVRAVAEVADQLRFEAVGDEVTYVANRNINYTNVCTFKCKFCAFSKGPLSLNLRGTPYLLELSEISDRVREAEALGATEVCLQGGIHPKFDGEYYLEVIKAVREASATIHIHGFTALEVTEGARRSEHAAGRLPGPPARRRPQDPARARPPRSSTTRCGRCCARTRSTPRSGSSPTAPPTRSGLRSNVTIMFGAVEQPRSWARHLVRTRDLQLETGGFTEFVPLPFVHMATPIYLQRRSRRGPTFRETLLMHAVGRIAYRAAIDNIQISWVKMGADGVRQILRAGVNDLGGTLMDENISRAAGASHGQMMDADAVRAPSSRPLGRHPGPAHHAVRAGRRDRGPHRARSPPPTDGPAAPRPPAGRRRTRLRRPGRTAPSTAWSRRWSPTEPPPAQRRLVPVDAGDGGRPGRRRHRGDRPEGGRLRPGRDGRGLPGVPALPAPAEGDHLRLGPHPARPSRLPERPGPGRLHGRRRLDGGHRGRARASWPPAWRARDGTSRSA